MKKKLSKRNRPEGRPEAYISLTELEKLCALNCTDEEIGAFFRVSAKTIQRRKEDPEFAEAINRGRATGRLSIRREQMRMMQAGNATMGIWLGKQLLGQRDFQSIQLTGSGPSGEIEISATSAREELLSRINRISQRAGTPGDPQRPN